MIILVHYWLLLFHWTGGFELDSVYMLISTPITLRTLIATWRQAELMWKPPPCCRPRMNWFIGPATRGMNMKRCVLRDLFVYRVRVHVHVGSQTCYARIYGYSVYTVFYYSIFNPNPCAHICKHLFRFMHNFASNKLPNIDAWAPCYASGREIRSSE